MILGGTLGGWPSVSSGLDASGVLVVYNANSADSQEIADYYAAFHPGVALCPLSNVPDQEVVSQDVYLNQIRPYVLDALDDTIDCIVTTKGLPLRIDNSSPGDPLLVNVHSSLESELTRIDTISSAAQMGNQMPSMPSIPPMFTNPDVIR